MAKIVKTQVEIEGTWHEREVLVEEEDLTPWDSDAVLSLVGKPVRRVDGIERTSGAARYTFDVQLPGMLVGKIMRSPLPHARVKSVDVSEAEALPGVRAIMTGTQAPDLFPETVRFEGEEVAVVVADDEDIAKDALSLIRVEYEEFPFVCDPAKALEPGAPQVGEESNEAGGPNVHERGDIKHGFAEADVIVDRKYSTRAALHNCFETHGGVAQWEGDYLTVWYSTQFIFGVRAALAKAFELPLKNVRVIKKYIGGGFGSKIGPGRVGIIAAKLARQTGRPVKIMLDRHEENLAAGNRPPANIHVRLGARQDGELTAVELHSISAVGPSGGPPPVAGPARELYRCANVKTTEQGVYTNTGPSSAFRAPGYVEGTFALESAMDELAHQLELDPVDLRMKNYAERQQVRDMPYSTKDLASSYKIGKEKIGWESRGRLQKKGAKRRGIGVASQIWGGGGAPPSYAIMRMNADGTFEVLTGTQDIGTGTKTVMTQIAAEEIGVSLEKVQVVVGDTLSGPYGILSAGSLTVPSVGPPVRMAAKKVKEQIIDIASALIDVDARQLSIRDGIVRAGGDVDKTITVDEVAEKVGDYMIIGKGVRGPNPEEHNVNTFGAQFAEVEVDLQTGAVDVIKIVAVHEFGRVLNPLTLSSQVEGGVLQGLGFGLMEGRVIDRNTGKMVNANLTDYKLPTALDVPEIEFEAVNQVDPIATSIGSKGAGEPPIIPAAAAIANAVFDAMGVRIYDLPITPDKVLRAVQDSAKGSRG